VSVTVEYDAERDMAIRRRVHWVVCPTCLAPAGAGCVLKATGQPTALHRTRITAAQKAVDADRAEPQTGRIRWTDGTLTGFVDGAEAFQVHDVRHSGKGFMLRGLAHWVAVIQLGYHPTLDEAKDAAERALAQFIEQRGEEQQ
jgi:hypothetical protein